MLRLIKPSRFLLAAAALAIGAGCSHKGPHSVTLRWNPPPGVPVAGYNLYRSTTSGGDFAKLAGPLPGPPYEDRLVLSGRTYFYVATTVDTSGHESRYSSEIQVTIP